MGEVERRKNNQQHTENISPRKSSLLKNHREERFSVSTSRPYILPL